MRWPIVVQGCEVDEEKVRWLSGWIAEHAHWSRRKLAGELCVLWDWRDGSGRPKDLAARSFLLKIEQRGWITLPPLREAYRKPRANTRLPAHVPMQEPLAAGFGESCVGLRKALTKLSALVLTSAREVCDILALQAMRPPPPPRLEVDLVV